MTEKRNAHYVLEYLERGMKSIDIARELKISRQRVTQILKAHGIEVRKGKLTPTRAVYDGIGAPLTVTTPEMREQMKQRFRDGLTVNEVAVEFGCSYAWAWKIVHSENGG